MTTDELREHWKAYRKTWGGGMVPFDSAFFDAVRAGDSDAQAWPKGADALMESFLTWIEARTP